VLTDRWSDDSVLAVVCLCAAWCDSCNEFRTTYERIAQSRPGILFVWVDIEDDSEMCGDVDVENFPTLAIYRGDTVLHFGVSQPQEGIVGRLVDEMRERTEGIADAPAAVLQLPRALKRQNE
jgi:thioredoxin reductase (NADPH)